MPRKPKKPCKHQGCPKLTDGIYCEEHEALHRSDRTSPSGRGYDSRWRRARSRFLKTHPLCVRCQEQGRLVKEMTWRELAEKYNVSETMIAKYRRKAMAEMKELYLMREKTACCYFLD